MKRHCTVAPLIFLAFLLSACTQKKNDVRVTDEPAVSVPTSRSEPVFYNGKTYRLGLVKSPDGSFSMTVSGMSAKQEKDAVAVATSSLRYFACKDSQTSRLISSPAYSNGKWSLQASCV